MVKGALTLTDIVNKGLIHSSLTMFVRVNAPLNLNLPLGLTGGGVYPPDSCLSLFNHYFRLRRQLFFLYFEKVKFDCTGGDFSRVLLI